MTVDRISLAAMCVEVLACLFVFGFILATALSGYGYMTARPALPDQHIHSRKGVHP